MNVESLVKLINKNADLVVGQSGSEADETSTAKLAKQKTGIVDAIKAIDMRFNEMNAERVKLVELKTALQGELSNLNDLLKKKNILKSKNIDSLIIRECRKRFTAEEWGKIESTAVYLHRKHDK